jgi:hypothetical protein
MGKSYLICIIQADHMSIVWQFIEDRISPKGGRFSIVGDVADVEFMIVTRRAKFDGYRGMDPSLIPQFKEGQ